MEYYVVVRTGLVSVLLWEIRKILLTRFVRIMKDCILLHIT